MRHLDSLGALAGLDDDRHPRVDARDVRGDVGNRRPGGRPHGLRIGATLDLADELIRQSGEPLEVAARVVGHGGRLAELMVVPRVMATLRTSLRAAQRIREARHRALERIAAQCENRAAGLL